MNNSLTATIGVLTTALAMSVLTNLSSAGSGPSRGDDFGAVVKLIEQFYHVKHQSIPLLARASMKAATTAARIKGGEYKRLAEAGSARIVFFEDQDFHWRGGLTGFR